MGWWEKRGGKSIIHRPPSVIEGLVGYNGVVDTATHTWPSFALLSTVEWVSERSGSRIYSVTLTGIKRQTRSFSFWLQKVCSVYGFQLNWFLPYWRMKHVLWSAAHSILYVAVDDHWVKVFRPNGRAVMWMQSGLSMITMCLSPLHLTIFDVGFIQTPLNRPNMTSQWPHIHNVHISNYLVIHAQENSLWTDHHQTTIM